MFILISLKTEIARSVNGPKLQGLRAEDAMVKAVPRADNFGDLITAHHKVLSDNCGLETIIDTQSWYRILLLNGSRRIRAKTKLHKKLREACKSSWNPRGNQKSFTQTIPWNSAKLVKISPGIIARLHHTDQTQMVLRKEQCAE